MAHSGRRCSAGAVGIFGQLCSLGQAPLFGAGWLWGNHNPPWRGLGTTQASPEQDSAVPRGEGTSPPSCLALPGLGAKQGLSSWDGAREEPAGAEPDPLWLLVLAWAAPKTSRLPCCWFWSSIPPCSASSTGCPRGQQSPAGLLLDGSDSLCLLKITCTYPLVPPYM